MKITIDNKVLEAEEGKTILEIAKNNGIEIPTLCFLEGFEPYGGCLLCIVEIENIPRLVPSCGTRVSEGMKVFTDTPKVKEARKLCLELLLSAHWGDCLSPCRMKCPANIDIEGFIRLIKEGDYEASYNLIMENLPFPASVGRVCPAFCEENCRRNLKEGSLVIRELKRFVGDWALKSQESESQRVRESNGKRVAIVGGGPAGLSCAYYLAKEGYSITIFEKNDKLGGMMRYGIPEYRLPKEILDAEIDRIIKIGVEIKTNTCIGKDEISSLDFDAIFIAIGCQKDIKLGIAGEELSLVISGIKLLKDVAEGKKPNLGKNVCIIGGGNTAIDCARTSLRLGADRVFILYRRGRDEMPASKKEISEAEEEGIKIEFLVAPNRVFEDGIECIKMELGEPDSSGRRKPIPIKASEFKIKANTIIAAIGQRSDEGFLLSDEKIFKGGDCVSGPATVVEAIADGKKGAIAIMNYLNTEGRGQKAEGRMYNCVREGISSEDIIAEEQIRYKTKVVSVSARKENFIEIEGTMDEKDAKKEAERCLKCGCEKLDDCLLRKYASMYDVNPERVSGFIEKKVVDTSSPVIKYDPNKCILCSRCIRVCLEIKKLGILGFVGRGYGTQIQGGFGESLLNAGCDGCLECVQTCPTGAFVKRY
ncbi:MAG: FAD-dependent oxidoreductase [bacterium]